MTVLSYGLSCCFSVLFWLLLQPVCCLSMSNITMSTPLLRNETLASPGGIFEMGFFQANGSGSVYVGIWYKNIYSSPIVWVANRQNPLSSTDRLASLVVGANKNLMLMDERNNTIWSTNVSNPSGDTSAVLYDNGNFVLVDVQSGNNIWSSFDEPCDTLLAGMKIGINVKTGEKTFLVSWKSPSDPSLGDFSIRVTDEIPTQPFILNGSSPYWRGGPWDKAKFIGIPDMNSRYLSEFVVEQDIQQETAYFSFVARRSSLLSYMTMLSSGILQVSYWDDKAKNWLPDSEYPANQCDVYGACGPFGVCSSVTSPICRCLAGFKPKSVSEWNKGNWTGGCVRTSELNCQRNASSSAGTKQDVFLQMSRMKVPDHHAFLSDVDDVGECQGSCQSNCSCLAYSFVSGIGCMVWTEDLVDIQEFTGSDAGEDLYLRLSHINSGSLSRTQKLIIGFIIMASSIVILGPGVFVLWRRRAKRHGTSNRKLEDSIDNSPGGPPKIFNFRTILDATDNFSSINKLGQGGFGPVYKGKLQDRKNVAVKRLSSNSGQGVEEFKNEITSISKLQHRNLVKLLGYCVEGDEMILVYDYLSNKSLDTFLFDPKRKLRWEARMHIIEGITRGLIYLHRDSCLRIIHRDLKASNILLDEDMNPYISDFGLARIFEGTHDLVNTQRVVGTLGYMAPEYAMGGIFSEKSDVYSFGVLLLEILSSRKNTSFYCSGEHFNLITYAWKLWKENRALEFIKEEILEDSTSSSEVMMKCIQIALLCVQDHAEDRPNMSSVVLMLSGESDTAHPKEPMFTFQRRSDFEVPTPHDSILSRKIITHSLLVEGR